LSGASTTVPARLRRGVRRLAARASLGPRTRTNVRRRRLAITYLHGSGLEIGALHCPLWVPAGVTVRYVDRMDIAGLRHQYPELADERLVDVDVIDDGEVLATQADASADFLIANHFIEHTEDPIGTLAAHLRVLRRGGILYLAVPDRRRTFDAGRAPTTLEHLIRDHREGPTGSRAAHQEEWARVVDRLSEDEVPARVRWLEEHDYSIHFHVWTPAEFRELLEYARDEERLPFTIAELVPNGREFVVILRRRGKDEPQPAAGEHSEKLP
jgi:SAM-dependent methyltransferase